MKEKNTEKFLRITEEDVQKAAQLLQKYKQGKINLERRIVENEKWWKMQHWSLLGKSNPSDPETTSAWLFNSIAHKHADAMDNFPEPCILPREKSDTEVAAMLSEIIPAILEHNDFEKTYSDVWWYKLKTGTGCYGVFWNNRLSQGLGDIDIKQIDVLNMFWESGIKDIQDSRNIFCVELEANDLLYEKYPYLEGTLSESSFDVCQYIYDDAVDTSEKSAVVDWYYKKNIGGRDVVHYCKFVNDTVLYASENDPLLFERGFYDHGKYPFVFDTLFSDEGTPCGFGYIDVMKNVQMYIDKLNQIILKNALQSGRRRFFISDNSGINEEEFADWTKEFVHTTGSLDERNIKEIQVSQLDGSVIALLNQKIEELKETSGTRDISQGGTASGVTAASAIAALQEAGSKLSRDMIKSSYRAFRKINYLVIELMRQFYDEPRCFRISGKKDGLEFLSVQNDMLYEKIPYESEGKNVLREPGFDIVVSGQKKNPFSTSAQNELAKELYKLGIFNPNLANQALACLEMMSFDGKEKVMEKIKENASMYVQMPTHQTKSNTTSPESDMMRAYKQNFPGQNTIKEAKRGLGI